MHTQLHPVSDALSPLIIQRSKRLQRGYKVKALARNPQKAAEVLGQQPNLEVSTGVRQATAALTDI